MKEQARATGRYTVECLDVNGDLLWSRAITNLVTLEGKAFALDTLFEGDGYIAEWYLGLIAADGYTTGPAEGDTMAVHPGWAEDMHYAQETRLAPTWHAASGGSKATQTVAFAMNDEVTIKGAFMATNSAKAGTDGVLYSAGVFDDGDVEVFPAQTLRVVWTGGL
jgi:hypothetical protein